MVGLYLPKFDAGRVAGARRARATDDGVPRARDGRAARRPSGLRDGRPLEPGRRCRSAARPLAPNTLLALQERLPDATRVELLRDDRGRPRVHRHAKGGGDEADRLGGQAHPADGDQDRRRRRQRARGRARSASCSPGCRDASASTTSDPDATASTWTADGWLRSGDLGYLDEDGFLYLVGRKKDLIIRGGHNVYPTDIEAVIHEHPEVREAAVVGVPHAVLGEDVAAFVVLQAGRGRRRRRAPGVLRRAARRLQAPPPGALRRRAAPQRHRQGA